jgi:Mg-chelatase subunit ChlD
MTMLRTTVKKKEGEMRAAMKEKEIRSVIRQVVLAESVDLAFILDATGSMGAYIDGVKSNIRAIVKQIMHTNGNLTLRMGVVAYRDIKDKKRFEVLDFVTSVDEFETFVGSLEADGGGDTPEDIAGGLQQANKLSWSNPTRVAFLIADAPCHGRDYYDGDIGAMTIRMAHQVSTSRMSLQPFLEAALQMVARWR